MSFPRYPKYKESGVEWLGEVPEHWDVVPAKRRIRSASGGTAIKGQCSDEPSEGLYPGFSASGQDIWLESYDFNVPGIVLSAVGARCGKTFKADAAWGVVANTHCLFPIQESNRNFLWYLTNQEDWWEKGGSAQPFVKVSETLARKWVFPSHSEQTFIAAFLDRETAKIDGLMEEQRRLIELLKEKRQAIISHAVTKGLNPRAPMKPSGIEWLGDMPSHWEVTHLRRLVKSGTTITYGIVQAGPDIEDGIPYIRTSDMAGELLPETGYMRTTPEIDASYARSKVRPNDLVVAIRASLGKGLLVPEFLDGANLTQGTARICPGENLIPRFLLWSFNSSYCQTSIGAVAKGTTFLEITLDALRRIPLAVPPLAEQAAIAAHLDLEIAKLETLTAEALRAIDLLQERRTALIGRANIESPRRISRPAPIGTDRVRPWGVLSRGDTRKRERFSFVCRPAPATRRDDYFAPVSWRALVPSAAPAKMASRQPPASANDATCHRCRDSSRWVF
jgi:type I restriction enzyme S subunit